MPETMLCYIVVLQIGHCGVFPTRNVLPLITDASKLDDGFGAVVLKPKYYNHINIF